MGQIKSEISHVKKEIKSEIGHVQNELNGKMDKIIEMLGKKWKTNQIWKFET